MYKDENPELTAAATSSLYVSSSLAAISHLVGFVASYADKSDLTAAGAAKLEEIVENLRDERDKIKSVACVDERAPTSARVAPTEFTSLIDRQRAHQV